MASKRRGKTLFSRANREKTRFVRLTKWIIRFIAAAFLSIFAYLIFNDIQASSIVTPIAAGIIWRLALFIYYWAWVAGVTFDTNKQEEAYVSLPGKGKWPAQAFGALAVFVGMAYVLLDSRDNVVYFSLALTAFVATDHAIWFYLRSFLRESIAESRQLYTQERLWYELEILNTVEEQVFGRWKFYRLIFGVLIVIIADVYAFSPAFQNAAGGLVTRLFPWLSVAEAGAVFYSVLIFLFVMVMEVWHWFMRARTFVRVRTLEELSDVYDLRARRS